MSFRVKADDLYGKDLCKDNPKQTCEAMAYYVNALIKAHEDTLAVIQSDNGVSWCTKYFNKGDNWTARLYDVKKIEK